jgi:hypothetical protein
MDRLSAAQQWSDISNRLLQSSLMSGHAARAWFARNTAGVSEDLSSVCIFATVGVWRTCPRRVECACTRPADAVPACCS